MLNVTGYLNLSGKENPLRGQEGCSEVAEHVKLVVKRAMRVT